jgi:chromate transporter
MMDRLPLLFGVFAYVSLFTFGGDLSAFPELEKLAIEDYHWFNVKQLVHIYSLGQVAPGPNLFVASLGERVAGLPGSLVAVVAYLLPTSLIALGAGRIWTRLEQWRWRNAIQQGLAPVAVGLITAGSMHLATWALDDWSGAVIAAAACMVVLRFRISPVIVILCGALVGLVGYMYS